MNLCQCGCGRPVRLKTHKYIHGHNCRENFKGIPLSEEHKKKISKMNKGCKSWNKGQSWCMRCGKSPLVING